jgi:hypothetical protein
MDQSALSHPKPGAFNQSAADATEKAMRKIFARFFLVTH